MAEKKAEQENAPHASKVPDSAKSAAEQQLKDFASGSKVIDPNVDAENVESSTVLAIDSDKSAESLAAEKSAKDPAVPITSDLTPANRDRLLALQERLEKHEINNDEFNAQVSEFVRAGIPVGVVADVTKLPIERFIPPGSRGFALTTEQRTKHDDLQKEVEKLRANRNISDIPLNDPYWSKNNEFQTFMANVRR